MFVIGFRDTAPVLVAWPAGRVRRYDRASARPPSDRRAGPGEQHDRRADVLRGSQRVLTGLFGGLRPAEVEQVRRPQTAQASRPDRGGPPLAQRPLGHGE